MSFADRNCTPSPLMPGTHDAFSACWAVAPSPDESMRKCDLGEQSSKCHCPNVLGPPSGDVMMPPSDSMTPLSSSTGGGGALPSSNVVLASGAPESLGGPVPTDPASTGTGTPTPPSTPTVMTP